MDAVVRCRDPASGQGLSTSQTLGVLAMSFHSGHYPQPQEASLAKPKHPQPGRCLDNAKA